MKSVPLILSAMFFSQCLYPPLSSAQTRSLPVHNVNDKEPLVIMPVDSTRLPALCHDCKAGSIYRVMVDKTALKAMKTGDKFTLRLPEGQYRVVHDTRMSHPNGDISWMGYLEKPGPDFRLMLTLGSDSLTGQLTTPKASYQFEQQGQDIWLVNRTAAGIRELPLHNDALVPPIMPIQR